MEKIEHTLISPIKVQSKINGKYEFVELETVYLLAPSKKEREITRSLKKQFLGAILLLPQSIDMDKAKAGLEQDGESKIDATAVKFILYAVKDFDINKFFELFLSLFSRVAYKDIDLESKLQSLELNNIEEDDLEDMIAKYIEFFFATSWMKTLSKD